MDNWEYTNGRNKKRKVEKKSTNYGKRGAVLY